MAHWTVLFNHLKSKNEWVPSCLPHTTPDLHFQVHFSMHNRISPLRLALIDGCNRVCSTLLSLFRKKPALTEKKMRFNRTNIVDATRHCNVMPVTGQRQPLVPNCSRVGSNLLRVELLHVHSFGKMDTAPILCDLVQKDPEPCSCCLLNDDIGQVMRRISQESQNRVSAVESASLVQSIKNILAFARSNPCHNMPETQPARSDEAKRTRKDCCATNNNEIADLLLDVCVSNCVCVDKKKAMMQKAHHLAAWDIGNEVKTATTAANLHEVCRSCLSDRIQKGKMHEKQWRPARKLGFAALVTMGTLPMVCPRGFSQSHLISANMLMDALSLDPREKIIFKEGLWFPPPLSVIPVEVEEGSQPFGPCLSTANQTTW